MKRSEMLNAIEHILYWSDNKDLKKQAESILDHIENYGMRPPNLYPYDTLEAEYDEFGSQLIKFFYKGQRVKFHPPEHKWEEE